MPFDLETWKREAAAKLAQFKHTAAHASSHMTYTTLVTLTLWPVVEAIGRGDVAGAINALMGAGAAAGAGIITQKALDWKGKTGAEIEREAAQWIEHSAVSDPALRSDLDKILTALDAVAHAQAGLSEADRAWFVETLRQEARSIGSTIKVVKIKTGGGMVIGKGARVSAGADVTGHDKKSVAKASRKGIAVAGSSNVTITQKNVTVAGSESRADRRRRYLKALAEKMNELPLRVFNPNESHSRAARHEMHLSGVYIALDTTALAELEVKARRGLRFMLREERRPLGALEAVFKHRRAAILGKPGSGKSTFAKHLAYCLAVAQTEPKADLTEFWENGWSKREKGWLPVFVILRDFDAWLRNLDPKPKQATAAHLRDFIQHMLEADALEYAWPVVESALDKGKALVVLDGLDEVPTTEMRLFVRDAIAAFVKHYPDNRYLLTCRSESYLEPTSDDAPDLRIPVFEDEHVFTLADLDRPKITDFIARWYGELQATKRRTQIEADYKRRTLLENLGRYDLLDLAANPLQLTLMAWVHTEDELPQKRAKLYDRAIDLLLWQWEKTKREPLAEVPTLEKLAAEIDDKEKIKFALAEAAFLAHAQLPLPEGAGDADRTALADVSEEAFEKLLYPLKKIGDLPDKNWAQQVVQAIKSRSGLLAPRLPGALTFPHRTFQEYLAGAHLLRQRNFPREADRLASQNIALWRQVILLAVGKSRHRDQQELHRDAEPLARQLLSGLNLDNADAQPDGAWRKAALAGDVLVEAGAVIRSRDGEAGVQEHIAADPNADPELLDKARQALLALVQGGKLTARERVEAAEALARLGDPRFDPDHWHLPAEPDFGFVRVPAGPFLMGTRKEDFEPLMEKLGIPKGDWNYFEDEINPRPETHVPEFYIARYPVTVAQFRAFVEDRRAADPTFKLTDEDALDGLPTHPVRYVTWHEAMAYCDWLTEKIQEARAQNPNKFSQFFPSASLQGRSAIFNFQFSIFNFQFSILNFPAQRGRVGEGRAGRTSTPL